VTPPTFTVELDRPRQVAWTNRALVRYSAVARPRAGALYEIAARLWAALVDRDHPFEAPEDLGDYLQTSEQVRAIGDALIAARKASEKKAPCSTPGPSPSSS
jgi:hypothetical protein